MGGKSGLVGGPDIPNRISPTLPNPWQDHPIDAWQRSILVRDVLRQRGKIT